MINANDGVDQLLAKFGSWSPWLPWTGARAVAPRLADVNPDYAERLTLWLVQHGWDDWFNKPDNET